jgi:hypothetical protein
LFILLPVETCFILTKFKQIKELERDLTLQEFRQNALRVLPTGGGISNK